MHDFGEDLGDEYYKARYRTMLEDGGFEKLKDELSEELYAGNYNMIVLDYAADILSERLVRNQERPPVPQKHDEIIYFYKRLHKMDWPLKAIHLRIAEFMGFRESTINNRIRDIKSKFGKDFNQWPSNLSEWDEVGLDAKLIKKKRKTKKAK